MWNWFNCYLSGRHEYGMWCEPGAIFLRCHPLRPPLSRMGARRQAPDAVITAPERASSTVTAPRASAQVRRSIDAAAAR